MTEHHDPSAHHAYPAHLADVWAQLQPQLSTDQHTLLLRACLHDAPSAGEAWTRRRDEATRKGRRLDELPYNPARETHAVVHAVGKVDEDCFAADATASGHSAE